MSFQVHLGFKIISLVVVFFCLSENVRAAYENNPFFQGGNKPVLVQTLPTTKPPLVTQPPVISNIYTTKEPIFTIEPPDILYGGNDLRRFCLKPRGQFPADTCKTYVNCWDGVAVKQSCLGNFLFNPVKLYCDYPENVNCQEKPISKKEILTPSAASTESISSASSVSNPTTNVPPAPYHVLPGINPSLRKHCLRSTGLFPGSKCSKFVNCWNDNAVEQDCPPGLHFSSDGYCDYPENAQCGNEIPATIHARDGDCPLEFGNFRNRSHCSHYYTCSFFKVAARYNCPEGFSFSDVLGLCDYSYRVDCSKDPQIFDIRGHELPFNAFAHPDLLLPAQDSRCAGISNGLVRDQRNCSQYYVCEFGKEVATFLCPYGYKFSSELGSCDLEEKVNCNNPNKAFEIGSSNIVIPNLSKEVLSQVQKCVSGTVFRLNPQCTSACRCRDGVAEIIQCTGGLAYDSATDKCVLSHLAGCQPLQNRNKPYSPFKYTFNIHTKK